MNESLEVTDVENVEVTDWYGESSDILKSFYCLWIWFSLIMIYLWFLTVVFVLYTVDLLQQVTDTIHLR